MVHLLYRGFYENDAFNYITSFAGRRKLAAPRKRRGLANRLSARYTHADALEFARVEIERGVTAGKRPRRRRPGPCLPRAPADDDTPALLEAEATDEDEGSLRQGVPEGGSDDWWGAKEPLESPSTPLEAF